MRLYHCRTAPFQFVPQGAHDMRMVVANIVHTITGEEIEDAISFVGEQFRSHATLVADVHLQQIEKPHPFRIHTLGIALGGAFRQFELEGRVH